jgi:diguanylate cyclase (GGDEF)-like protein/PAS domain S-box-containing protein
MEDKMREGISTRSVIIYGFLSVIIILIAVTSVGMLRIQNLTAGLDTVVKDREEQIMLMHSMRHAARERSILLQSMMITSDPFTIDDYAMDMSRQAGKYSRSREQLLKHQLSAIEHALLGKQNAQTQQTGASQNQIIRLINEEERLSAEQQLRDIALPGQRAAMAMMDQFIELKRQQNISDLEQTRKDIDFTYGLMIALSLIGVVFSLGIAYFVSSRINGEMRKRMTTEGELRHSELRERTIRENIIDGVLTLDNVGTILSCNRACKAIFGCDANTMVGKSAHMLLPTSFSDQRPLNLGRHLKVWEKKMLGTGHEVIGRRKDNSEFPAELDVSMVELGGETTYIVVIRDITEKKAAEQRLQQFNRELEQQVSLRTEELASTNQALRTEIDERIRAQQELTHLASHDSLTELPNRAFFTEQLTTAMFHAERRNNLLGLLFMDLDGFKLINDTHGHEAGDQLLIEVSRRMKQAVRREDIVARMGGDEFTVILNELSGQRNAEHIAEKIIHAVNQPITCGDVECQVGISIGIAYYPHNGNNADALIRHADDAMYEAKAAGKNRYRRSNSDVHIATSIA